MDRGLILQMLSKLPPERLGQLISEAQGTSEGMNRPLMGNEQLGLQSGGMQQRELPPAYRDVQGRYF